MRRKVAPAISEIFSKLCSNGGAHFGSICANNDHLQSQCPASRQRGSAREPQPFLILSRNVGFDPVINHLCLNCDLFTESIAPGLQTRIIDQSKSFEQLIILKILRFKY